MTNRYKDIRDAVADMFITLIVTVGFYIHGCYMGAVSLGGLECL